MGFLCDRQGPCYAIAWQDGQIEHVRPSVAEDVGIVDLSLPDVTAAKEKAAKEAEQAAKKLAAQQEKDNEKTVAAQARAKAREEAIAQGKEPPPVHPDDMPRHKRVKSESPKVGDAESPNEGESEATKEPEAKPAAKSHAKKATAK